MNAYADILGQFWLAIAALVFAMAAMLFNHWFVEPWKEERRIEKIINESEVLNKNKGR